MTHIVPIVMDISPDVHILIVDDSSPDGTAQLVKDMQIKYPGRLFLKERPGKQGLGTAYIAGFKWGLEHGYDYIFEMDADFSHPPEKLPELYAACVNGANLAIGSRYTSGGRVKDWPIDRVLMSYFASIYVRSITFLPVADTTAGFVCFRRKVLETINLDKITFIGYAFQIEMKYAAWKLGFKLKEVPITFIDRTAGSSKMSTGIFKEAFKGVWTLRFRQARKYYKS